MIPVLYTSNETAFTSYGIGALTDAVSCVIVQEINGQYELMMQYPITGIHYGSIELRTIIKAKPDRITEAQLFRIYRITKPINGIVTIYARHIAYDLSGIAVSPFTAQGLLTAFAGFTTYAVSDCPFSFTTDKSNVGEFTVSVPSAIWRLLGADDGCILAVYGGEYEFDNYTVNLLNRRGTNRGVSVRYGKNMTDIEQDANIADCYTAVYPFYRKENSDGTAVFVELPEKTVAALGTYGYTKVLPLDLSSEFEVQPTVEQLRQKATEYITANDIGTPKVSWKVEFVSLEQSNEYANTALFESVYLGDDVLVEFEKLGVNATARAVKIEYNVLLDRYDSVTLGSVKSNLADTIISQQKEIEKKPTKTMMENIAETLTNTLLGVNGGSVRLLDTNGDGEPDTLYIADNPDPAQAVKVWRWNYEGWAASSNGYNGPFVFGATLDEGILANAVTAAHLTAGTIRSEDGQTFLLDLANGSIYTLASQTYLASNYSNADLTRITNIILGYIEPTDIDLEKYDFYGDGIITTQDQVLCRNIINSGTDMTVTWRYALDPSSKTALFKIWRETSGATTSVQVLACIGVAKADLNNLFVDGYAVKDSVIESGTSGIWTYRKYASGAAECWGGKQFTVSTSETIGSLYYGTVDASDYPTGLFTESPSVLADATSDNDTIFWLATGSSSGKPTASSTGTRKLMRTSSTTLYGYIYYHAIGRWK